jgi:putative LysE/RhtB family amino acid efflux pump
MGTNAALFARMLVIGLVVAAPVGAMAVLCIQRVLAHGWWAGIATGGGIATADAIYAGLAAFGVTAVSRWLIDYQMALRIAGGLVLIWLGWRAIRTPPAHDAAASAGSTRLGALYTSAVGLTLTNPLTIMSFAAIFAGAGLVAQTGTGSALIVTLGVGCGSLLWWFALSTGVWAVRRAVSDRSMLVVNRVSGGVLVAFGVIAVVAGLRG